jgi:hypothetical protein
MLFMRIPTVALAIAVDICKAVADTVTVPVLFAAAVALAVAIAILELIPGSPPSKSHVGPLVVTEAIAILVHEIVANPIPVQVASVA